MATTFTLTGTFKHQDGVTPVVGSGLNVKAAPYPDTSLKVYLTRGVNAATDANGSFSLTLESRSGLYYKIKSTARTPLFDPIVFLAPAAGATVDITSLTFYNPSTPPSETILSGYASTASAAATTATNAYYAGLGARKQLANWYAAIENRENAAADAVLISDSTGEGTGAGSWTARVQYVLNGLMKTKYPLASGRAGAGYIPALQAPGVPASPVTLAGPGTISNFYDAFGLGLKAVKANSNSYAEWPATTCDRYQVFYGQAPTFTGHGAIALDGATVTTYNSVAAANAEQVYDSGAITRASHTVRVTGTDGANQGAIIEGVRFYDGDYNKGVTVLDGSHAGYKSGDVITSQANSTMWSVLGTIKPSLYIYALGINDWGNNTPATYLANVDTFLANCATANGTKPYSVLLVSMWRPVKNIVTSPSDWQAYRDGLKAREGGNVAWFDVGGSWPDLVASTTYPLMSETDYPIHPNASGHAMFAQLLSKAISPADNPVPGPIGPTGVTGPGVTTVATRFTTTGSDQSYTIPTGTVALRLRVQSAGSGGGSGRRGAAASNRCGGGGGAGGTYTEVYLAKSDISAISTLFVDVGAGGTGGAAVSVDSTDGATGGTGGASRVKTASGGATILNTLAQASAGTGGSGGTATNGVGGTGGIGQVQGGAGANASTGGGVGVAGSLAGGAAAGGASGGGITSANVQSAGGTGSQASSVATGVPAGGTAGGGAGNPGNNTIPLLAGQSGSGGGSNAAGAGGVGGAGGRGAGGAGGGASVNGSNSGAGGAGGDGYVEIIAHVAS